MKRRSRSTAMIAASMAVAAGCGYPTFQFTAGGAGGASSSTTTSTAKSTSTATSSSRSSATSSSGSTSTTASSSSTTSSSSTSSSSGAPCTLDHVVISQIRSRGLGGATDEFIELFNPTSADITLDENWTIDGRGASLTTLTYENRWTGYSADIIPAYGHFLIATAPGPSVPGYTQDPQPDDYLAESIGDEESLVLNLDGAQVDAVCYYYDSDGLFALENGVPSFTCAGMPVVNPHDDTNGTDVDASLERKPGGAAGNCADTGDNAVDFEILSPAVPEDSTSPPTPG